jgi:hypothetical protein
MAAKATTFIDKCIKDKHGKVVLAQRPNLPIAIWIVSVLVAWPLHGQLKHYIRIIGDGALFFRALLELFQGVNYSRRALGFVVLVMLFWM